MLWRAALMAWREHPLLGLGPDNFRRAYNRYLGLSRPDERLHANNLYLETLAGLGLAGIGALVLLVVGFAGAARTAIRHHGAASVAGLIAIGAAIGLAAYLVHGFFDYFLEFTPTYGLLWLLAGIVAGLAARDTAKAIE
jgi:O-antigen ligase